MVKKLTLLAMAIGALVALAAPAAVQANEFTHTGEITVHGEVAWTWGAFRSGPCTVSGTGEVEGTIGEISSFTIKNPCPTNVPNCPIEAAEASVPMEVHPTTPDGITFTNMTFYNVYTGAGCAAVGIPTGIKIPWAGSLTGTTTTTGLIHFEAAGDLKNELTGGAISTDGTMQLTDVEGNPLIIH